jgi:hypothetical protein
MATDDDLRSILGPWHNANLVKTAKTDSGIGVDDDIPPRVRFVSSVAKLVRRRIAQPGYAAEPKLPAIFLFRPTPSGIGKSAEAKRIPMLDNGLTSVSGRVWYVGAVARSGQYVELDKLDDDAIFNFVTAGLDEGGTQAILFDPRPMTPQLRLYNKGLSYPDEFEHIELGADVSLNNVMSAIDGTYRDDLITPEAQPAAMKLWCNHDKWFPVQNAEDVVQGYLKVGLNRAFPTCEIRHEQTMAEGRSDIEIEERDPLNRGSVTRHALLELKILRSFGETGNVYSPATTLAWIESGVKQASSYRDSKGSKWSALCCFDMRKVNDGDICFDHVRPLAEGLKVTLKRWFLYAKSEYLREALAARGLGGG